MMEQKLHIKAILTHIIKDILEVRCIRYLTGEKNEKQQGLRTKDGVAVISAKALQSKGMA